MSRRADEHIPHVILEAAQAAGQDAPLYYAGRSNGHEKKPVTPSAHEVVLEARRRAGIVGEPAMPKFGPVVPDPFAGS